MQPKLIPNKTKQRISRIKYLREILKSEKAAKSKSIRSHWTYYDTTLSTVNSIFGLKLQNQIARHKKNQKIKITT